MVRFVVPLAYSAKPARIQLRRQQFPRVLPVKDLMFGFVLSLSVGPVAMLIVNYAIRSGSMYAARAALGAATADGIYALIAFTIGALITSTLIDHVRLFKLTGSILLLVMGLRMFWHATKPRASTAGVRHQLSGRPFSSILLITLANPLTVLLFYGYATSLPATRPNWVLGPVSVFIGSLGGQMVFATGGSAIGRFIKSRRALDASNVIGALVVMAYGLVGLLGVGNPGYS